MLLPPALGFSPHPPVSVYGTGTLQTIAAFLGSVGSGTSLLIVSLRITSRLTSGDLPPEDDFPLAPVFPLPAFLTLLRPHSSVIR